MKGEIISLTPAPDWCALLHIPSNGLVACPLIGWALVRYESRNHLCGMMVSNAGCTVSAESLPEFVGYAPMQPADEGVWANVVRKIVAHNAIPPLKP